MKDSGWLLFPAWDGMALATRCMKKAMLVLPSCGVRLTEHVVFSHRAMLPCWFGSQAEFLNVKYMA